MNSIGEKGYMWRFYGFTKLHLWGCHIVGGTLVAFGAGMLVVAALLSGELPDSTFQRLMLSSIACFVGAAAVACGSIFTLLYFAGRAHLRHSENELLRQDADANSDQHR